jgi:hypothetical protein
MTSKEKAKELYLKFHFAIPAIADEWQEGQNSAKECALIAVDELISSHNKWDDYAQTNSEEYYYWIEVKKEIEKL